jgi:Cu/Ag efflux pump CusA
VIDSAIIMVENGHKYPIERKSASPPATRLDRARKDATAAKEVGPQLFFPPLISR